MAEPYWRAGAPDRRRARRPWSGGMDRRRLRIGLVNNMPDGALAAAERQFTALLQAAAPERQVEMQLFHLPGVARGEAARARLGALYRPAEALADAELDAVVVTGAEPRADDLRAEPFWDGLARLADRVERAELPTLWSCLAAHAAVLHRDGLQRRRLPQKCSGLYRCRAAGADPLLAGMEPAWVTPHSRWNTLDAPALERCGYRVLGRSGRAGVDAFVHDLGPALQLFLQGHPEYEPLSLPLEFRRDLQRYLRAEREAPPTLPTGVFGPESTRSLQALLEQACTARSPDLMALYPPEPELQLAHNSWRSPAAALCRNWLLAGLGEAPPLAPSAADPHRTPSTHPA